MPNDKPLSFMVFPQLSLEIREFLYKVVLTYIHTYIHTYILHIYTVYYTGDRRFSGNLWKSATSSPPELKEIETWQTTHFEDN